MISLREFDGGIEHRPLKFDALRLSHQHTKQNRLGGFFLVR
uniref:Uncharacterized protein n=1 Tax=Vibrio splendidus TaxID=29497 RepID=A0A0H3ZRI8_VIBSP|nr:hypothetical protein [Vibrio splendidus]